jgi:methyl-accepting chemotaxis protein
MNNFFSKFRIKVQLIITFGFINVLFLTFILYSYLQMGELSNFTEKLYDEPFTISITIRNIKSDIISIREIMKSLVLTKDKSQISKHIDSINKLDHEIIKNIEILKMKYVGNEEEIEEARVNYESWANIRQQLLKLKNSPNSERYDEIIKDGGASDSYFRILDQIIEIQDKAVLKAKNFMTDATSFKTKILNVTIFIGLLSIILVLYSSYHIFHNLMRQLGAEPAYVLEISKQISNGDFTAEIEINNKDQNSVLYSFKNIIDSFGSILFQIQNSSEHILMSSKQLFESSQLLAGGSTDQANSIGEITSSLTQIEAQSSQNSDNSLTASQLSKKLNQSSNNGQEVMTKLNLAMEELETVSEKIFKVVKEIESIAFQTNILALNAAVEAARAGQHGKGFNVVATEVRNLAVRSSTSAKETTNMVEEVIKKISHSLKLTQLTSESFNTIAEDITILHQLVDGIAVSSNEQKIGITQVNSAVSEISKITMSNASSSEQIASASEELTGQAESFKNMLSNFKIKSSQESLSIETKRKIKL